VTPADAAPHTSARRSTRASPTAPSESRTRRTKLPRRQVTELQRARLLAAAIEVLAERGYAQLTVAAVISRARVSRKTFYDIFRNCEDCFLEALEDTLAQADALARDAYAGGTSWRDGMRAALAALLELMEDEPALARLWVVDAHAGDAAVWACRSRTLAELARAVDAGRGSAKGARRLPQIAAQGVVGGVLGVLHSRLVRSREPQLVDLRGPLMYMIVLPYLGPAEAAKELERADRLPRARAVASSPSTDDPLKGLDIRLTYRTVRVLSVISDRPGASNREVATYAEVADQGQISKLLGRLARLQLIENRGMGQINGAANSWHLTRRGTAVVQATRQTRRMPAM
jgi:AcrR family transcriptional regulator